MAYAKQPRSQSTGLRGYGRPRAVVGTGRGVARDGNVTDMLSSYASKSNGSQQRRRMGRDGRDRNLGFVVPAILIQGAGQFIGGLFNGDDKDAKIRLPSNAGAYAAAQAGDPDALSYLKARSGQFGAFVVNWVDAAHPSPGMTEGWATTTARRDAYTKYAAVMGSKGVDVQNASLAPAPGAANPIQDFFTGFFSTKAGSQVQTSAIKGAATVQAQKLQAALPMILTIGSVALIVMNIASNKRRA